jgi:hypothetical protein
VVICLGRELFYEVIAIRRLKNIHQATDILYLNPDFAIESAHAHSMGFMSSFSIKLNGD